MGNGNYTHDRENTMLLRHNHISETVIYLKMIYKEYSLCYYQYYYSINIKQCRTMRKERNHFKQKTIMKH